MLLIFQHQYKSILFILLEIIEKGLNLVKKEFFVIPIIKLMII